MVAHQIKFMSVSPLECVQMDTPNNFGASTRSAIGATRGRVYKMWGISVLLGVLTLTSWATFAYNAHSSAAVQKHLYDHIAQLTVSHVQLIAEHEESVAYLTAARQAMSVLGARLERVTTDCDQVKAPVAVSREIAGSSAAPTETGSVQTPNPWRKPILSRTQRRVGDDQRKQQLP
jgi:hypothetical protein